jgi:hypothetical protein
MTEIGDAMMRMDTHWRRYLRVIEQHQVTNRMITNEIFKLGLFLPPEYRESLIALLKRNAEDLFDLGEVIELTGNDMIEVATLFEKSIDEATA